MPSYNTPIATSQMTKWSLARCLLNFEDKAVIFLINSEDANAAIERYIVEINQQEVIRRWEGGPNGRPRFAAIVTPDGGVMWNTLKNALLVAKTLRPIPAELEPWLVANGLDPEAFRDAPRT